MTNKNVKILGIIPARGGSKRIPRKNLKEIAGRPLLYYTIEAVKASRYLSEIIVSSDDDEIIEYAKSQGVKVPFKRPAHLATDQASSYDVVLHALNFMERHTAVIYQYVCLLEPTAPLRRTKDIDGAIEKLLDSDCDSLISLISSSSPYRIRYIENDKVRLAFPDEFQKFIKDKSRYPKAYIPGGGLFISKTESLRFQSSLTPAKTIGYIMSNFLGLDINTKDDLIIAECLLKKKEKFNNVNV
jgi:N-acylneuraminate cytidylyltransferase